MKQSLRSFLFLFILLSAVSAYSQDSRVSISYGGMLAADDSRLSSSHFDMTQNSPNPFSAVTDISFYMPANGFIEFKVVNLIGKEVIRQVMEADPGRNNIRFDGNDFMPGVYVYSISNGSQTLTRRMIISKK
jgi:hypothetical protein